MQNFAVVALVVCVAQAVSALAPCDDNIIRDIQDCWGDYPPNRIMATLARNGEGVLIYSTEDIPLKDVPVDDPKCVKGQFTKDTSKFTIVPSDGELDASRAHSSLKVTEEPGIVYEDGGKVAKYIIANKFGVTGFYSCATEDGNDEESPAAGIAVAVKKFKKARRFIEDIKSDMEDLGFSFDIEYADDCVK